MHGAARLNIGTADSPWISRIHRRRYRVTGCFELRGTLVILGFLPLGGTLPLLGFLTTRGGAWRVLGFYMALARFPILDFYPFRDDAYPEWFS